MQQSTITIGIYGCRFTACIGLLPQERSVPQEYLLTVTLTVPAARAEANPSELNASISYADIYEEAANEMSADHELLEETAISLARRLKVRWPSVTEGEVSLRKTNPPIPGICGEAGIVYRF